MSAFGHRTAVEPDLCFGDVRRFPPELRDAAAAAAARVAALAEEGRLSGGRN
jgi:hypothetical protein